MIGKIALREILENFLSLRFMLSFLLSTSLFAVSAYVFVADYPEQMDDYRSKTNKNVMALKGQTDALYKVALYTQGIYRKPSLFAVCAEGRENTLPNYFEANAFTAALPAYKGRINTVSSGLGHVDWVHIVSMILSFTALVFTYESISGKKRAGTLCLTLANTITRHEILLGKYLGAMFTLTVPLLAGILANLLIVMHSKDVTIDAEGGIRIATIVFLSLLYISIFIWLGLLISSRTAHPSNSMAVLLLVWIVSVIFLPGLCRIIYDVAVKEPSQVELERRLEEVSREIWRNRDRYGERAGHMSRDPDDPGNNPPARARLKNAVNDARNQVREGYHNKLLAQALGRRHVASISPAVVYQRACEAFSGTGLDRCIDLYAQCKRYRSELETFIRERDREDPKSLHLFNPERSSLRSWMAVSHQPVDFDLVPKFREQAPALGHCLQRAIWDTGLLVLFNLVFATAAFVSFLRYDVR